jgi:phosphate transport system permease protein
VSAAGGVVHGAPPGDATRAQQRAAARARPLAARRRSRARRMTLLTALAALVTVAPLASILVFLLVRGAGAFAPGLLTRNDAGGDTSAFANALAGSVVLLTVACVLGVPAGLGAGLYLHERRGTRRAALLRYLADVLLGVPSIIVGVVAWQLLVRPAGHFSAWAGGAALAALIVPLVARTTDDVLGLVPTALSEAALALGYPRWRTSLTIVLRSAAPGVATGVLVAVARVAGEAAPLLFTAFGNQFWSLDPSRPIAALPLQIYTGALGASSAARQQAYAGALVLIAAIAIFGLIARRAVERATRSATPAEGERQPSIEHERAVRAGTGR